MEKCVFDDNVFANIGGEIEVDPCIYEDIEAYKNVTVIVSRCKKCGHVEICWKRQQDTEEIPVEDVL